MGAHSKNGLCGDCKLEEAPITEASKVRNRIFEAGANQKSLVISFQEAVALRQFIETLEADPFSNPKAVLDTLDMQKLDLEVDDTEQGEEKDDPFTNGKPEGADQATPQPVGTDRIPVDTAVVAPDATPYHDEPIPASVLASLQVLQSKDQEQPVDLNTPASIPSVAPANGPTVNGMPIGQTRPAPSPSPNPMEAKVKASQAPVLTEGDVSIRQIMGNWRRAFKATKSE